MDYSFNKFNVMTKQEKLRELTSQIIELKKLGNTVDTKKTIQTLQKEMDSLTAKDNLFS